MEVGKRPVFYWLPGLLALQGEEPLQWRCCRGCQRRREEGITLTSRGTSRVSRNVKVCWLSIIKDRQQVLWYDFIVQLGHSIRTRTRDGHSPF